MYPDDGESWGRDECYDALLYDYPELADDAVFQNMFDDLFPDRGGDFNWDDAQDAYDALDRHLHDYYDLDIDDYFDWEDWREAYNEAA